MAEANEWQTILGVAREVTTRGKSDPAFREQYQEDPVGTLLAMGMPEIGVLEVMHDDGFSDDDVAGFLAPHLSFGIGSRPTLTPPSGPALGGGGSPIAGPAGGLGGVMSCPLTGCPCTGCCVTNW